MKTATINICEPEVIYRGIDVSKIKWLTQTAIPGQLADVDAKRIPTVGIITCDDELIHLLDLNGDLVAAIQQRRAEWNLDPVPWHSQNVPVAIDVGRASQPAPTEPFRHEPLSLLKMRRHNFTPTPGIERDCAFLPEAVLTAEETIIPEDGRPIVLVKLIGNDQSLVLADPDRTVLAKVMAARKQSAATVVPLLEQLAALTKKNQ